MVVIIDYGMGNVHSVSNMIRHIGYESVVSDDPEVIKNAEKLILPGVGNFGKAMELIVQKNLRPILEDKVLVQKKPILGICLGMQLLMDYSEEGHCSGLGWIPGTVRRFEFIKESELKVPHMGWDFLDICNKTKLVDGVEPDSRFYFVHSYYVTCQERQHCVATTDYGFVFDSIVQKDNIMGTQFHPEKSHKFGMNIIRNFLEY